MALLIFFFIPFLQYDTLLDLLDGMKNLYFPLLLFLYFFSLFSFFNIFLPIFQELNIAAVYFLVLCYIKCYIMYQHAIMQHMWSMLGSSPKSKAWYQFSIDVQKRGLGYSLSLRLYIYIYGNANTSFNYLVNVLTS